MDYYNKSCRACLDQKESFSYYLFDNVSPELFTLCTSLEINKEDALPKCLCSFCYELILKFTEFKDKCVETHTILLGALSKVIENKSLKTEPLESDTDADDTNLNEHDSQDEKVLDVEYKAEDIEIGNNYDIPINNDLRSKQSNLKIEKKWIPNVNSKRPFVYNCNVCNKKFRVPERFEAHKLYHEGKSTSIHCKVCSKTFMTWSGLKRHKDSDHTPALSNAKCHVCGKTYKNIRTLQTHAYSHGNKQFCICDVCGKEFKCKFNLKVHLATHKKDREREFACKHCDMKFFTSSVLASHVSKTHKGRRFICHICNYPFTDKYNLAKHFLTIHDGVKPYKCEVCNKAYSNQYTLVEHKRIHSGEKPYTCVVCSKSFISKKRIKEHYRIHTGDRPYKCTICTMTFTQRGSLTRHIKGHSNIQRCQ